MRIETTNMIEWPSLHFSTIFGGWRPPLSLSPTIFLVAVIMSTAWQLAYDWFTDQSGSAVSIRRWPWLVLACVLAHSYSTQSVIQSRTTNGSSKTNATRRRFHGLRATQKNDELWRRRKHKHLAVSLSQ